MFQWLKTWFRRRAFWKGQVDGVRRYAEETYKNYRYWSSLAKEKSAELDEARHVLVMLRAETKRFERLCDQLGVDAYLVEDHVCRVAMIISQGNVEWVNEDCHGLPIDDHLQYSIADAQCLCCGETRRDMLVREYDSRERTPNV